MKGFGMRDTAGRVISLHRFPVKSLLGERLDAVDVDERGVVGDRTWSIRTSDNKIGSGKTTRRFAAVPGLLGLRAHTGVSGVTITLPTGEDHLAHAPATARVLSELLGQPITVAQESNVSHFDDGPVSLIGLASVRALAAEVGQEIDPGRFRANILVEGLPPFAEDSLVGQHVRIGDVSLEVAMRSPRCVMIDMETADLPSQPGNLLAAGRLNDACLGVVARVAGPGTIRVGDRFLVSEPGGV
jgi:uncharacterized protein YcbX